MTDTSPDLETLRIRTEEDVLALVSVTFGFHPRESLVMVAVGDDDRTFHARVDLPVHPAHLAPTLGPLVDAVRRNGARRALLVAYTDDVSLASRCLTRLASRLERRGTLVHLSLRVDGDRWWPSPGERGPGRRFDLTGHPLVAAAVLRGQVIHASREDLVASVERSDPQRAAEVAARAAALVATEGEPCAEEERAWLVATVEEAAASGAPLSSDDQARLLLRLQDPVLRDEVWGGMRRSDAEGHVRFLRDLLPACPPPLVAPPAALLAFAAWLAGDGALAWCAVERARAADPELALAGLVAQALENAVPPSTWDDTAGEPRR